MADTASVKIVVDAITQAAQQGLEDVGDELRGLGRDGEIAQSVMNEVGDELGNAAADAGFFAVVADRAKEQVSDLAVSMGILQSTADEAGDEIAEAGGKALLSSGLFSSLSISTEGAALSFGSLSTSITLALLPALVALATTLVPLAGMFVTIAAAATGLVGAFGAIIGSGILAYGDKLSDQNKKRLDQINTEISRLEQLKEARDGLTKSQRVELARAKLTVRRMESQAEAAEKLTSKQRDRLDAAQETIATLEEEATKEGTLTTEEQKRLDTLKQKKKALEDQTSVTGALAGKLSDLKAELTPLIVDFGQKFIPLIENAIDAVPDLVQNTLDAVGGLDEFKSVLQDFGGAAADAIPQIASTLVDLGRDALPVLKDVAGFLATDGADAFQTMVQTTKDLGPTFKDFIGTLVENAPAINKFGTNVLKTLVPALGDLVDVAADAMEEVDWEMVREALGDIGSAIEDVAPHLKDFLGELGEASPFLLKVGQTVGKVLVPAMNALLDVLTWALDAFNDLSLGQKKALFVAIAAVVAVLSGGLLGLVAAIAAVAVAWPTIKKAGKKAMQAVDDAVQGTKQFLGGLGQFITRDLPQYFVIGLSAIVSSFNWLRNTVHNIWADLFNSLLGMATKGINGLLSQLISGANALISKINAAIRTANQTIPGFDMKQMSRLEQTQIDTTGLEIERRRTDQSAMMRESARAMAMTLNLNVEGDGPLAQLLRENLQAHGEATTNEQARYRRRQNIGSPGVRPQ